MGCGGSKPKATPAAAPASTLLQEPVGAIKDWKKALIVCTSAAKMGDHDTGLWSEECTGPYYVFKDAGCEVNVCSIGGGDITIDAGSVSETFKTANDTRMEKEDNVIFKNSPKLADLDVTSYDIVFFSGGHGTCVDFPTDVVGAAVSKALSAGKVVAAVCHGPMALVNAKTEQGDPVVKGKKMACFTDKEEDAVGLTAKVPFSLEAKMKELGATVEVADPWADKAVRDGNLVTGQNPQSSVSVAKLCLETVRRALIVCTSATKMGEHDTGLWSEECTGPYYVFKDAGLDVTVCSIGGGDVTIDAGSVSETFKTENDTRMEKDGNVAFKGTAKLADLDVTAYDIVFFSGGHGTCVDFPTDEVGAAVSKAWTAGKVVAAVCHGPMALVNAKTAKGEPIVKGMKVACFTDKEEDVVGLTAKVPFLLETKMKELGATIQAAEPWADNAVRDGNLVTGQNPQSSVSVAKLSLQYDIDI